MHHTKRLLALLLTLILAFTLAMPAFAEDVPPEEPDPAMPVITVQPQDIGIKEFFIFIFGKAVTLSVQAYIPNGDEVGCQWYIDGKSIEGETGSTLQVRDEGDTRRYHVEVFNQTNPEDVVKSNSVRVESAREKLRKNLTFLFYPITLPLVALFELLLLFGITIVPLLTLPFAAIYGWLK